MESRLQRALTEFEPDARLLRAWPLTGGISAQMTAKVHDMLKQVTWDKDDISHFLGIYLSEPKAHIVFSPPRKISAEKFVARLVADGIQLALQSQMLFSGEKVYLNGETAPLPADAKIALQTLANTRFLAPAATYSSSLVKLLHQWYLAGFLVF